MQREGETATPTKSDRVAITDGTVDQKEKRKGDSAMRLRGIGDWWVQKAPWHRSPSIRD